MQPYHGTKDGAHFVNRGVSEFPLTLAVLFLFVRFLHAHAPGLVLFFLCFPPSTRNGRGISTHITIASNSGFDVHLRMTSSTRWSAGSRSARRMDNGRARINSTFACPAGKLLLPDKKYQNEVEQEEQMMTGTCKFMTKQTLWRLAANVTKMHMLSHRCSGFCSAALTMRGAAAVGAGAACF
jgi:hypothetical protein